MGASRQKTSGLLRISTATIVLSLLASCSFKVSPIRYEEERRIATVAMDRFKDLFNNQKFEEIYEMTDERAKATKSKTALIALLATLRDNRGTIRVLEPVDSPVKSQASYTEVVLIFNTKFENGESRATFTWYVTDGKASLFSMQFE